MTRSLAGLDGWTLRRPTLADVPAILAVVHLASDVAAVGEPDFTTEEGWWEILQAPNHDCDRGLLARGRPRGPALAGWAYLHNPSTGRQRQPRRLRPPGVRPPA